MCIVKIPKLLVEFYNKEIIFSIIMCTGVLIKVGMNMYWAVKGKYVRIYMEIEFHKPLISKLMVENLLL